MDPQMDIKEDVRMADGMLQRHTCFLLFCFIFWVMGTAVLAQDDSVAESHVTPALCPGLEGVQTVSARSEGHTDRVRLDEWLIIEVTDVQALLCGAQVQLYLDGKLVARSTKFDAHNYKLNANTSLKIGFGQHDYFNGKMRDLRFYDRELSAREITEVYSLSAPE